MALFTYLRKKNTQKQIKSWSEKLTLNLKGGVWVGIFTLTMWAGVVNTLFLDGKDIPDGVIWVYGTILTAFAGTKIVGKVMNGKNGNTVEEND